MQIIHTSQLEFKNSIIELYLESFEKGDSEQFIDKNELTQYIQKFLEEGIVLLAIENNETIGALLSCSMIYDKYVTNVITENFETNKCVYVAEMMVKQNFRGMGIGGKLLNQFLQMNEIKQFTNAFIRVWDQNTAALGLYVKMGFEPYTTILQTKIKADGKTTYQMKKIYLHKNIE